jgi:ubiquinone/menaquinone biosynthesis C-methylase UbiE
MGRFLNRKTAAHNELVRQEQAVVSSDRVLEVGFGGAALLERLGEEVTSGFVAGVEVSEEMLALAARRLRRAIATGRVGVKRGSIEALPFAEAEFDKACSVNTTYFWPDLAAGLAELRRVVRPGGRLVLGFVSADDMVRDGLDRHGFACHSTEQLTAAVEAASFSLGRVSSGSDSRGTFYVLTAERVGQEDRVRVCG